MRSLRLVVAAATYPYRGLLQRAVRGQPEVVAQTTRIGFAYASFGASLCVFY